MLDSRDTQNSRWARFPSGPAAFEIWNDFNNEMTVDATGTSASPVVGAAIASGTGVMTVDQLGGVIRFANATTTDDSGYQIQQDMETVTLQTSKEAWFIFRFTLSEATQSSCFAGVAITDTTIQHATTDTLAAGLTISDGFGIFKPDGEATGYLVAIRDSVQQAVGPVLTLATATPIVVAFKVNMTDTAGEGQITCYVNGVEKGAIRSTTLPYSAEEVLALSFAYKSGDTTNQTCDLDYWGALVER